MIYDDVQYIFKDHFPGIGTHKVEIDHVFVGATGLIVSLKVVEEDDD